MANDTRSAEPRRASPGPRVVPCEAYGPVKVPLGEVLGPSGELNLNLEIKGRDYFTITLKKSELVLRVGGWVGFIPLNEHVVVRVQPRVPVTNLTRIVNLSGYPPTILTSLRSYETVETEIVSRGEHRGEQQVEVGEHRGPLGRRRELGGSSETR